MKQESKVLKGRARTMHLFPLWSKYLDSVLKSKRPYYKWVSFGRESRLRIYMRFAPRFPMPGVDDPGIVVASVYKIKGSPTGMWRSFMIALERYAIKNNISRVVVENVKNPEVRAGLIKHGYEMTGMQGTSFVKLLMSQPVLR